MATQSLDNGLDWTGCLLGSLQPVLGSWATSILCIYQTLSVVLDKAAFLLGTFCWPFYLVDLGSSCDLLSVSSEVFVLSNKMSFRPLPLLKTLSSFRLVIWDQACNDKSEDMGECRHVFSFSLLILFYFSTG